MLTVQNYDYQEKNSRAYLSNRFLRAFRAGLFENGGFPTVIYDESEIVRYIDSQHAESFQNYFHNLCKGLSEDEFSAIICMTNTLYKYTYGTYGQEFLVKAPILDAVYCWRLIRAIAGSDVNIRVMEAGAGSGMLGGLLLQQGYSYIGTDVTQAFYLTSNRILSLFTDSLCEQAVDQQKYDEQSQCVHIPYWKLWENRAQEGGVDIFTCNHALLEMHQNAARFYLKIAKQRMAKSKYGFFVIRGFGWGVQRTIAELLSDFDSFEYKLQYFDFDQDTAVFSLNGDSVYSQVLQCLRNLSYAETEEYHIYGLGKNTKVKLNKSAFATEIVGKKIQKYLSEIDTPIGMETLEKAYRKITPYQDSPDEVFGNFVRG